MQYGLIGEKLGHSYSKEIHTAFGKYDYELKELSKDEVKDFILGKQFKGLNVTIPYKETVMEYLDFIDDEAKAIGAVNTVVNKDGKLYGYNTDFYGMLEVLKDTGFDFDFSSFKEAVSISPMAGFGSLIGILLTCFFDAGYKKYIITFVIGLLHWEDYISVLSTKTNRSLWGTVYEAKNS